MDEGCDPTAVDLWSWPRRGAAAVFLAMIGSVAVAVVALAVTGLVAVAVATALWLNVRGFDKAWPWCPWR